MIIQKVKDDVASDSPAGEEGEAEEDVGEELSVLDDTEMGVVIKRSVTVVGPEDASVDVAVSSQRESKTDTRLGLGTSICRMCV